MHYTSSRNIQTNLSTDKDDNFADIYHNKGFLADKKLRWWSEN